MLSPALVSADPTHMIKSKLKLRCCILFHQTYFLMPNCAEFRVGFPNCDRISPRTMYTISSGRPGHPGKNYPLPLLTSPSMRLLATYECIIYSKAALRAALCTSSPCIKWQLISGSWQYGFSVPAAGGITLDNAYKPRGQMSEVNDERHYRTLYSKRAVTNERTAISTARCCA